MICSLHKAFSIIELMVVLVILALSVLVATIVAPQRDAMQVQSATESVTAMMTYAQNYSITHGRPIQMLFSDDGTSVELQDQNGIVLKGNVLDTVNDYRLTFTSHRGMSEVRVHSADFDGSRVIWFDAFGVPHGGAIEENPPGLASGEVILRAGENQMIIRVETITGEIRVL